MSHSVMTVTLLDGQTLSGRATQSLEELSQILSGVTDGFLVTKDLHDQYGIIVVAINQIKYIRIKDADDV